MGSSYSGSRRTRSSSGKEHEDLERWRKNSQEVHRRDSIEAAKTPALFRDIRSSNDRVVLYTTDGVSPNGFRVDLTLREKSVIFNKKMIDETNGEHRTPEYTTINPRQRTPTLIHDDIIITESCAAMQYIDAVFNRDIRLQPKDPVRLAKCLQYIHEFECNLDPKNVAHKVLQQQMGRDQLVEEIEALEAELVIWDGYLKDKEYLVDDFSLADIAVFPLIAQLTECFGLDLADYPNLRRWYSNMRDRPSLEEHPFFAACAKIDTLHGITSAQRMVLARQ
ncbi:Glutathione S-transferase A, putative [Perkinsus marinus ATCC 50983]|uniref:Glutathione S-transferase A, putative n=1 Tax=Perkinsus marinus (strain ATCC 50983 / TXsc) TaxID=423536 RepID=C5KBL6_PERM5|nr:Glutathione S-transferase A, putative [Perkinsus marinus ATCC 50983]EER18136.1 Glutathione S-transferase A, putative [Perkinsus marinus ATCC 50983]|eukprot:XP_002786340.1 Glutathione S-transferase A, putative [Perkinsus marinus ATCC 50983]